MGTAAKAFRVPQPEFQLSWGTMLFFQWTLKLLEPVSRSLQSNFTALSVYFSFHSLTSYSTPTNCLLLFSKEFLLVQYYWYAIDASFLLFLLSYLILAIKSPVLIHSLILHSRPGHAPELPPPVHSTECPLGKFHRNALSSLPHRWLTHY